MSSGEAAFRRVLVALDASRESRSALEASAEIASRLGATLVGLFVEDVNLLRMAALPAARVLAPGSGARDLDVPTIERALRAAAAESRDVLEAIARRTALPCAFRIVRGVVAAEVAAGSLAGDLVIVDRRTAGAAWTAMVAGARISILILDARAADRGSVLAVYPAEVSWEAGVWGVAHLAGATGRRLAVVRPPDADAADFDRRLGELLGASGVSWETISVPGGVDVLEVTARLRPGAVVAVPSNLVPIDSEDDVADLLRRAGCSTLLVR